MAKNTPTGAEVVADTRRYLGIKYVFGGGPQNPQAGLDCSGLVMRVALDLGWTSCPRTSEQQWTWCEKLKGPIIGGLVFFVGAPEETGSPGHVAIVTGPNEMIDAPFTGAVVRYDKFQDPGTGYMQVVGYGKFSGMPGVGSANQNIVGQADVLSTQNRVASAGAAAGGLLGVGLFAALLLLLLAGIAFGILILAKNN